MLRKLFQTGAAAVTIGLLLLLVGAMGLAVSGCSQGTAPGPPDEPGILEIRGEGVAAEARVRLAERKAMKEGLVEDDYFSVNSLGTKGYTRFKGVWVWYVLQNSVVLKDDASMVTFVAEDGYYIRFTLDEVRRDDYIDEQNPEKRYKMILAWEVDGRELNPDEGSPFQLAVGQKAPGDVNKPYWVRNVKAVVID